MRMKRRLKNPLRRRRTVVQLLRPLSLSRRWSLKLPRRKLLPREVSGCTLLQLLLLELQQLLKDQILWGQHLMQKLHLPLLPPLKCQLKQVPLLKPRRRLHQRLPRKRQPRILQIDSLASGDPRKRWWIPVSITATGVIGANGGTHNDEEVHRENLIFNTKSEKVTNLKKLMVRLFQGTLRSVFWRLDWKRQRRPWRGL